MVVKDKNKKKKDKKEKNNLSNSNSNDNNSSNNKNRSNSKNAKEDEEYSLTRSFKGKDVCLGTILFFLFTLTRPRPDLVLDLVHLSYLISFIFTVDHHSL